jgi:hypothetical protein
MNSAPEGLTQLLRPLAERISSSAHPSWPVPIFEAESYLYRYFLHRLLRVLDSLLDQSISWPDIAALFCRPSRIVEYCYLFLGFRFSDLDIPERIRLASHLIEVLSILRPDDTFCAGGTNRLIDQEQVDLLALEQRVLERQEQRRLVSCISAALFSICELIHVGIPQYGREGHGPYRTEPGRFMLIRSHYDLRLSELWPPLDKFPFDEIEIAETYKGTSNMVRFDLTNHLNASAEIQDGLEKVVIRGRFNGAVSVVENWQWLLKTILDTLEECLKSCHSFTRLDWLRKHLEARSIYLKPHCALILQSYRPAQQEYDHLNDPPPYFAIEKTLSSPFDEVFALLCSNFGIVAD